MKRGFIHLVGPAPTMARLLFSSLVSSRASLLDRYRVNRGRLSKPNGLRTYLWRGHRHRSVAAPRVPSNWDLRLRGRRSTVRRAQPHSGWKLSILLVGKQEDASILRALEAQGLEVGDLSPDTVRRAPDHGQDATRLGNQRSVADLQLRGGVLSPRKVDDTINLTSQYICDVVLPGREDLRHDAESLTVGDGHDQIFERRFDSQDFGPEIILRPWAEGGNGGNYVTHSGVGTNPSVAACGGGLSATSTRVPRV